MTEARRTSLLASDENSPALSVENVMEMIEQASYVATLEERHRLARELHDSVSQALFSMTLHARTVELALQKEGTDSDGPVVRGLAELRSLAQGAQAEMRVSLYQLRPDVLHENGLVEAIRTHAAATAARHRLDVRVHAGDDRLPLDEHVEHELFRVVCEAVHNSVKHAHPGRIDIRLDRSDSALTIEVADDGTGFDPARPSSGGVGLRCMRERIERVGGQFVIDSRPAGSTAVRAVLPIRPAGTPSTTGDPHRTALNEPIEATTFVTDLKARMAIALERLEEALTRGNDVDDLGTKNS
ncbi:MAG TPA: sensor histidine kinase [Amycolatopsis sp.]|nr:sensor histidine kinase [Amycolatopsis sp.]